MSAKKHTLQSKVYYSLKGLYFASVEIQREYREMLDRREVNIREFATIKFSGVRRLGHSTAIARLINDFNLWGAIVVPDRRMPDGIIASHPHFFRSERFAKCTINDCKNMFHYRHIPTFNKLDLVVVDNTTYLNDEKIELVYNSFMQPFSMAMNDNRTFFWIFVG